MTQDPTPYDLLQDSRIDDIADLISPDGYTPPGDEEYSFPVVGQGITAGQYRLMSLGQANGIIHGDNGVVNDSPGSTGYRYYLEGHASDSETNQRNTLFLRAGDSAEAIVEGFYHRLTQDMELSFPAVSTPTTYHVCLTYDPRREDEPTGPIHVEVYAGEPPTSHGRVHVILHTVEREPNQLLTQATRTRYRPYTAGVVSIQHEGQLPDVNSYPAGTLAVPSASGGRGLFVRSNTAPRRWVDVVKGEWQSMSPLLNNWGHAGAYAPQYRLTSLGVQFRGRIAPSNSTYTSNRFFQLPWELRPSSEMDFAIAANLQSGNPRLRIEPDGNMRVTTYQRTDLYWVDLSGIIAPIDPWLG